MVSSRKIKNGCRVGATYFSALLTLAALLAIFLYVFINGTPLLSWDLFASDYHSQTLTYSDNLTSSVYVKPEGNCGDFSEKWGIGFADGEDRAGNEVVRICYLDEKSPIYELPTKIEVGTFFTKAFLEDTSGNSVIVLAKDKAEAIATSFDGATTLTSISFTSEGGGIRGSLLSTLLVIVISLAIAMPLGIGAAVYFAYFAPKKSRWVPWLERMIEITSGVPSIIFGLIGVSVFIPLVNSISGAQSGSLLSGSLTMVLILLPTVVKTCEEAIKEVPASYRQASLALGASEGQSLYRVILPSALPGILSAAVLSTGRIIGESAALVLAIGTYISDSVSLTGQSATLAVEIWSLLAGENPNYRLASSIALLILLLVLVASALARFFTYLLKRKAGRA